MFGFRHFKGRFSRGNALELLINGEEFFPRLIERIEAARYEIFIETFILAKDQVGDQLQQALIKAARRGVWVSVTADSWGSHFLESGYIDELSRAGVVFQIYDPQPEWYNGRPKLFRRLHRKLAVIDGRYAYIGGINLCYDHMLECGPTGKQDYAVEIQGPVVNDIRKLCKSYVRDADDNNLGEARGLLSKQPEPGNCDIAFVARDNRRNRSDIEKAYLSAITQAKERVWLANAYFFPGYRVLRAMKKACKRGVDVRLVLQGDPDIPFALMVARTLYERMTRYGVKIYEYNARPLHAKIAVVDNEWSTIGSSNLDPLSLAFNLEANVIVCNREFNQQLAGEISKLEEESHLIEHNWIKRRRWWLVVKDVCMYHVLRHFPTMGGLLPAHTPKIREIKFRHETDQGSSRERDLAREYPESRNARKVRVTDDYDKTSEA